MSKALGIYIHVPFCKKKCPYCDFYSITKTSLIDDYVKAVIRNLESISDMKADTVYFGGGTPSLLTSSQFKEILSRINYTSNAEITIECNPKTVDKEEIYSYRCAGINRLSLGVQSLSNNELTTLGRIHNSADAELAVNSAKSAGFDNISADIMLGISGQTLDSIDETLEKLLLLPVTHISAYMLKIEENTPYYSDSKILSSLPDEDTVAEIYLRTVKKLSEYGYHQYEISNFAKQGYECKHNLKYWRCEDYYGIGPSAHSCINGKRFAVERDIEKFIFSPVQKTIITEENSCDFFEQAMLRLRLSEGLDLSLFPEYAEKIVRNAQPLVNSGLVRQKDNSIIITPDGYIVSNEIICRLLDIK